MSSPNTPGLRDYQRVKAIQAVIISAMDARDQVTGIDHSSLLSTMVVCITVMVTGFSFFFSSEISQGGDVLVSHFACV